MKITRRLQATSQQIGYPRRDPNVASPEDIQRWYSNLNISSNDYFSNVVSLRKLSISKQWSTAGATSDDGEWNSAPLEANAHYHQILSKIVLPAGILQPPVLYDQAMPLYLSYGLFGSIVGHELAHLLTITGLPDGLRLTSESPWNNYTFAVFQNRTECLVKQYNNYTKLVNNRTIATDGRKTKGENIADLSGVNFAFDAWKKQEALKPSEKLPGLEEFTNEQLFFIAWARLWCQKSNPQWTAWKMQNDVHALSGIRILVRTPELPLLSINVRPLLTGVGHNGKFA